MDLGQERGVPNFHGVGSRRQRVHSVEAFPTFRIKGVGAEGDGCNRGGGRGEKKRGTTEALATGAPLGKVESHFPFS